MKQRNDTFTILRAPRAWRLHIENYARKHDLTISEAVRRLVVIALADRLHDQAEPVVERKAA